MCRQPAVCCGRGTLRRNRVQRVSDRKLMHPVLWATIMASASGFINQSVVNVAIPAIQRNLDATGPQILWVINGYTLMLAALIPVSGALGDQKGRKLVFEIGIIVFIVGSILSALAPSPQLLIAFRVVQGIGAALLIPGSLSLINALVPDEDRGTAIGIWSASTTVTTIAGPLLGGPLVDLGLWRLVFVISVPFAAAALVVLILRVPESRAEHPPKHLDFPGAVALSVSLALLSWGFIVGGERTLGAIQAWLPVLIGSLLFVGFVLIEARSREPMVPLRLFRSPTFSGTNLMALLLYGALSAFGVFFTLNVQQMQGYSATLAGIAFLPFAIILTIMSPWAGRLCDHHGPRRFLILGPLLAGLGFAWSALIGLTEGPSQYFTTFFPGVALFGIGMGFTVAPLTTAVMGSVPKDASGTASGVNNAVTRLAGVLAVAVIGAVGIAAFGQAIVDLGPEAGLSSTQITELTSRAPDLGAAQVPAGFDEQASAAATRVLRDGFIGVYQLAAWICAALCFASAVMSWVFIRNDPREARATAAAR